MTVPDHAAVIDRFYAAFAMLDGTTMQSCYTRDAQFEDPVFTLHGQAQIGAMWRMLCDTTREKARDAWKLEVSGISADASNGQAHWEAYYRFTATGRQVHNVIDARFGFRDGLIATHRDHFDFWLWSRQALGLPGTLMGWTPMLRNKVRAKAAAGLAAFQRNGA